MGDIAAQAKANAAARAGFNEIIHGPGVEGVFAVHKLRVQAYVALLGRAQGGKIGQALPGFEIPGAQQCAIEIISLSKMAGFTGVRCGWTVVPAALQLDGASLHAMWLRRMSTKYNGTSYIIQRAAQRVFSAEGQAAVHADIAYYMENAHILKAALTRAGIWTTGGDNAPYVWLKAPDGQGSWEFFDKLLHTYGIAGTPGAGFGTAGEGYLRFSSFGTRETVQAAAALLETL